jgi:hypothetical protein
VRRVDLSQRRAFVVACDLTLGRIRRGDDDRCAELVRNRRDPFGEAFQVLACGPDVAGREIDELAREAVADRAPEVLFDQAVRKVR